MRRKVGLVSVTCGVTSWAGTAVKPAAAIGLTTSAVTPRSPMAVRHRALRMTVNSITPPIAKSEMASPDHGMSFTVCSPR